MGFPESVCRMRREEKAKEERAGGAGTLEEDTERAHSPLAPPTYIFVLLIPLSYVSLGELHLSPVCSFLVC